MGTVQILVILTSVLGVVLVAAMVALFLVSRRSQRVMESVLDVMMRPERARVQDAVRVLHTILGDEIVKIEQSFQTMRDTLNSQIASANELKQQLTIQNQKLVELADDATKKLATMSGRLDNTVGGLNEIVNSSSWDAASSAADRFNNTIGDLLGRIDTTTNETVERATKIQSSIDTWIASARELNEGLSAGFDANTTQMQTMTENATTMQEKLSELTTSVSGGFDAVKTSVTEYKDIMTDNDKLLDSHLEKLTTFTKQSKKQLTDQMNALTNTANVVGAQVRLAESSVDNQTRKLTDAVETLMSSASATENAVRGISTELSTLTNRFDGEIKEFATGVVSELKTVSGVANITLENTRTAAGAFSESVRAMATGVRETLMEMNTAHQQLSGQSETLIKMSTETTAQLQPLSELIEKYYAALPGLATGSAEVSENLGKIVANLNDKINMMKQTVSESTAQISESAVKLDDLAGTSRQQMIDLMSDYAKAVNTMQTLNKQMMVARASAPMDAIKTAPTQSFAPAASSSDFLKSIDATFDKLHEQSLDLTRATGADIPDVIWKKYHDGDKTIFSKWLAKMLGAADKKRIREMLKSDTVFRSQAAQFVRSFNKIMNAASQTDNPDKLTTTLLKTDLGRIYSALK